MSRILCVTGTGTEVGKTTVALSALLWAREAGLRASYLKLVQCGSRLPPEAGAFQGDAEWIEAAMPGAFSVSAVYAFQEAASPHLAAEKSGAWIDPEWIDEQVRAASDRCDLLVIEGAGGAASPFTRQGLSLADLAARGEWPCLLACPPGLGALHQARAASNFLVSRGARLAGFAMCQVAPDLPPVYADNTAMLQGLLEAPYFGLAPYCPGLNRRLPLPPAMALRFSRGMADGLVAWWAHK